MDNKAMFYRARYRTAEQFAQAKQYGKCLDILWDLRLNPEIGLYRRALVNLLIACTADVRKHPDKSKFAQECIDLVAQIRRSVLADDDEDSKKELLRIEQHAEQTLKDIEAEVEEAEARRRAKKSGEKSLETITTGILDKMELDEYVSATKGDTEARVEDSGTVKDAWTIEGAYADLKMGIVPKEKSKKQEEPKQLETPAPSSP